ncbi:MAG: hypothetical protein U0637_12660 [Phycisphaerales bacterium]
MRLSTLVCSTLCVGLWGAGAQTAHAQVENADLRIRAEMRIPNNASWGAGESLGNAEFRVHSRFLQLYYGGVHRNDEFRFSIQLDFTSISGFPAGFLTSPYNTSMDAYINNAFVGRVPMSATTTGIAELEFDSRHPSPPQLPLPANFPDPVNSGDVVRLFAAALTLPEVGDPLPSGVPLFERALQERFARGDVNQDRHVDLLDFAFLADNYDPFHLLGNHVGPATGDFTGDNLCDLADYDLFVHNWDGNGNAPAAPLPVAVGCDAIDYNHDGLFPDTTDIDDFLSVFSGGPCSTGICGDIDFNNDGLFPDTQDINDLLSVFSGGPCT